MRRVMSTETISEWLVRAGNVQDFDVDESDSNDKTACNECLEPIAPDEPRYTVSITEGSGSKRDYTVCHDCLHSVETELSAAKT